MKVIFQIHSLKILYNEVSIQLSDGKFSLLSESQTVNYFAKKVQLEKENKTLTIMLNIVQ